MSEHRQIDVGDGLSLHVEVDGDGPPVLLLHGFTGSTETWHHVVGSMRSRVRMTKR